VRDVRNNTDLQGDIMRIRFAGYLAMGVASAFLIVASYAFVADTFWWIALIGGIVIALLGVAEVAVSRRRAALTAPAGLAAVLGAAMAVIAAAASVDVTADWGFGLAIATAALSVAGLTEHELVAERDVRHPGTPALP
jgi:peptidoglycan/LPS O-acetylase OafA/YrhL